MALIDFVKSATSGGVIIETSFTPAFDASRLLAGASATTNDKAGDSLALRLMRPSVTVSGVRYAPFGEPLPLWQLGLLLAALVLAGKFLNKS